jgi:sugar lactone lactonase YvrE
MAHASRGNTQFLMRSLQNRGLRNRLLALLLCLLAYSPALLSQSPRIDSVDASRGPIAGGTTVTVKGANFQNATLWMDKVEIAPQAASATEIRFVTPRHDNGIVTLKVVSAAGSAYGEFLYVPPKLEDLPPGYITTVAGIGPFVGYYRSATQAVITAAGIAFDQKGNTYIADAGHNRIDVIRSNGILEPFAGNGRISSSGVSVGDNGIATEATLKFPRGVATDSGGNVYITDNSRIRRVDARTGVITTIAGNDTLGYSGDGGPATQARLNNAIHIVVDAQDNIFFFDFDDVSFTPRIRKITQDGIISTVAGVAPPGFSGDGGPAIQAQFDFGPGGSDFGDLAVDSQGNLYIADTGNLRIRRIEAKTGIITTVAGPNGPSSEGGGVNSAAAITVDRTDNVYYFYASGMKTSHIVKMNPSGQTIAIYGNTQDFSEDGTPIREASLPALIMDLAMDPSGNLAYVDSSFHRVRRLNFTSGNLETIAGIGPHVIGENGPAIAAVLNNIDGDLAFLPTGELLIGDSSNFLMRKLDRSGNISTFAGIGTGPWYTYDEVPASQAFVYPVSVKTDAAGRIFLTDVQTISRIDTDGIMRRVAGTFTICGLSGDGGPALNAQLCQPWDVALDAAGNLFIADTNNNRIRRVNAHTGIITTVAGSGPVNGSEHYGQGTFCGDGGLAIQACLNSPQGVAIDSESNLYISDTGNSRIRKVDINGIITTIVTNAATSKLVLDAAGNLYFPFGGIRRIDRYGTDTNIAGHGINDFLGDGGPALQAQIGGGKSVGIAISPEGDIFLVDGHNNRVRAVRYGAVLAPSNAQTQITGSRSQSTLPAMAFDYPLQVLVLDSSGNPAPGVRVDFSAPSGGPSCSFANGTASMGIVTDRAGYASATCTANAQLGAYNITATPLTAAATVSFALTNSVPRASIDLPLTSGSVEAVATIGNSEPTQSGYVSVGVRSGATPYGTAVFSFKQNGVTVTEAGVPASPPTRSARIFIDYRSKVNAVPARDSAGTIDINTGIAIVNYGSQEANVTYTLRDRNGSFLASGTGRIKAQNHVACFIDRLKNDAASDFNLPADFQSRIQFGSLDITADQPLSVLALRGTTNQRGEFLITTTPVADLAHVPGNGPMYFPQFVDGGGYTTSLILMNTSNVRETGRLEIRDKDGNPLTVNQVGGTNDYSFRYSIEPGGLFRFQTDGFPFDTKAGWVRLAPDAGTPTPIGSGVFGYNPNDVMVSESGIPAAAATTHARVYVDLSRNHNTGLAIANVSATGSNITINAYQKDGVTAAGTSKPPIPLPANGYTAGFADGLVTGLPAGFTGVLDIGSPVPFAALTLRSLDNERGDFLMTTFPVADVNQPAPSPIVFPHIVDGGGYVTQFILLSPGGGASTTIRFYAEDGTSLAVGK